MLDRTIGHYQILEKLGEGGMGVVYKARDLRLERFVAIKFLPADKRADEDRLRRFFLEARAASALNHPNIITIHDIAEHEGQTFIVMEFIDGKPLNDVIARKAMRLKEALRIAVQVADALTAAHAAGIVHRDLKPANIMVETGGRVRVLDFGLAKLSAVSASAAGVDEATRTMTIAQPQTEEGAIVGSVPYVSPEQAEGRPLDARSDIFSFGAVLYEMITGQRAFQGESRASTLAAVVEKDPPPTSEIAAGTPPELERLIARCLRKEVNRRSQHMADVKLALEELRDDSESGKLVRAAVIPVTRRLWPAIAIASVALAATALGWVYLGRPGGSPSQGQELVRLSPDDGHSYVAPSISADGKFVAYVSDRSGERQLWLQQVAGGDPIQLTHGADPVVAGMFFPDGDRLVYGSQSLDGKRGSIEVIPTLGGQPRILGATQKVYGGAFSPDGRQIAYIEQASSRTGARLMILSSEGGQPRELPAWAEIQPVQAFHGLAAWTSDNRYLLCVGSKRTTAATLEEWDWFAVPADGGSPRATGAGQVLRAAGLRLVEPSLIVGGRILFPGGRKDETHVWEIGFSPDNLRVRGAPRQLTFGTENELPFTISASGVATLQVVKPSMDLYLIPLSRDTGLPTGVSRRLTHDGRYKLRIAVAGSPGSAYFAVPDLATQSRSAYALDLESGRQTPLFTGLSYSTGAVVSPDGRQVAYSTPEGNSFSIRVGDAGANPKFARSLCKGCGAALRFSIDGRFLAYQPEATILRDSKRKYTARLLELATGKDRPWLEHPSDSVLVSGTFGEKSDWVIFDVRPVGANGEGRGYIAPWGEKPVSVSEWIEVKTSSRGIHSNFNPYGNFLQFFQGSKLMAVRFDPKTRAFSDPYEVKYLPGSPETLKPDDPWAIRGPGLVFWRQELSSSIWLTKLPQ